MNRVVGPFLSFYRPFRLGSRSGAAGRGSFASVFTAISKSGSESFSDGWAHTAEALAGTGRPTCRNSGRIADARPAH